MLDALESIRCFQTMQIVTRRHGRFRMQDLVEAGFKSYQARAYIQFCLSRRVIERLFDEQMAQGSMAQTWRAIGEFPPVRLAPSDDLRKVADAALSGIGRTARDREGIERHRRLWTSLRTLRQTTAIELAFVASGEECRITSQQALIYLLTLTSAGYVVRQQGDLFRLLPAMNSGSSPIIIRQKCVLDFNLMRAVNVTVSETSGRAA